MADIILALKPKWLELILSGKKTADFRRRMPQNIHREEKVYLYNKRALHGVATIDSLAYTLPDMDSCSLLAHGFEYQACLPHSLAFKYLLGGQRPGVLFFYNVHRFASPVPWTGPVVQNYIYAPPHMCPKTP